MYPRLTILPHYSRIRYKGVNGVSCADPEGRIGQINTELQPLIDFRNWFSLSIFGILLQIFFKLGMRVDIGKECRLLGLKMCKFWLISTELWPLIDVINWFFTIFGIPLPIFFKLGMRVDIGKECPGIADG